VCSLFFVGDPRSFAVLPPLRIDVVNAYEPPGLDGAQTTSPRDSSLLLAPIPSMLTSFVSPYESL